MKNSKSGDRDFLEKARAALRANDQDRAAPALAEFAERGTARAKAKVANDAG
jgi:hypothetical protein